MLNAPNLIPKLTAVEKALRDGNANTEKALLSCVVALRLLATDIIELSNNAKATDEKLRSADNRYPYGTTRAAGYNPFNDIFGGDL